ncbi:extracellular solute-binding protein [Ruminococcaceae bacterium OttesenSCG-928-L11]|nr:extracellular solute-binding protein [Ruminococcaceae bacterium OttesenSCG-928-L11]
MKTRRITALILAAMMAATVFSGCGGGSGSSTAASSTPPAASSSTAPASSSQPAGDSGSTSADGVDIDLSETVKFTAMAGFRPQHADFKDMGIIDEINAAANVEFAWELVPDASLNEKRSLALSTGDIPDVMFGMMKDPELMKNTSLFVPLDEYAQYTPNMVQIMKDDPAVEQFMTLSDGHYYSLAFWHEKPYEGAYNDLYINNDWLKAVGLELPNTIDEFEQMLIAFKTQDPNGNGEADEIPFTFILDHVYFGLFGMYGAFGSIDNNDTRLHIKDGQVYFTANKDEWKNATEWFAKLNSQGLLDVEGFTQDRSMLFAKGKSDPVLVGSMHAFLIDNVVGADRVPSYSYCLPLQGADGKRIARFNPNPISNRHTSVVSKNCKNIERMAYWLDLNLSEDFSLQNTYGLFGKQLVDSSDSNYTYEFALAPDGMSQDDFRFKDAPAHFPAYINADLYGTLKPAPDVARKVGYMNDTTEYLTTEWIPPVLFTDDESRELATLKSTVTDYVLQQQALWISNQSDITKDWDAYVAQLDALGVNRYVEIYQTAVDRYYGK